MAAGGKDLRNIFYVRLEHHQPGGKNWAKLLQGAWSNRKAWTPSRLREGIGLKVSNTSELGELGY